MSETQKQPQQPTDNYIQPFMLESSGLRGRSVRFGAVLNDILAAHNYPDEVAHLVAETIILTALLSSMLKYDGIFTLQASGDGALGTLAADMISNGDIRGCASYDNDKLEVALQDKGKEDLPAFKRLVGDGHMLFSVDHAGRKDRYQGVVALEGDSLTQSVQHYFTQSEQVKTAIKIAVDKQDGIWRGAGIMLQKMPDEGGNNDAETISNVNEDDWRRAMILMGSCTENELTDVALKTNDLLLRLFHEEGVRIFEPQALRKNCRCSQERVENIITSMSDAEKQELAKDGFIEVTCEFCSKSYKVKP